MLSYKVVLLALVSSVLAAPIPREVPQEHSHEAIVRAVNTSLKVSNPDNIQDAVFGLLGAAAAKNGAGNIADADCLQQATADQAFTNAKAAKDVEGMTTALLYRALERNTGAVGQASPLCSSIKAVNPEIAALTQHQDPAGQGAQAANKALTLTLAKQIASIGGDPVRALDAGTFAPGQIGDPTAKGNTCDDANDAVGCIVSQNLLVKDATEAEITAAVGGAAAGGAASGAAASGAANNAADNTGDAAASTSAAADSSASASADCGVRYFLILFAFVRSY
ncbi:hypothetical protein DL96DRAFT_1466823 [Flagelloscypha sp. PMI_526]|nr:hypothetical protein DL96DRAFT_1466823 [Flagelloscypha sp. PMI_526]